MIEGEKGIPELWAWGYEKQYVKSDGTLSPRTRQYYSRVLLPVHHCDDPEMFWTVTYMHAEVMIFDLTDDGVPLGEIKWEVRTPIVIASSDD